VSALLDELLARGALAAIDVSLARRLTSMVGEEGHDEVALAVALVS
jgi:hypothetical protein